MARKKCKKCLSCFTVFWVNGQRYYSCWLCKDIWTGQDSNLQLVLEDPRKTLNISVEEKEQEDEQNNHVV